ncbi:MAG: vitamin K epoxide reductase family protein, partial [Anaerolineae bacterium]
MNKLASASLFTSLFGLLDSIYLLVIKFSHSKALCGPVGDCYTVNTSRYSEIFGVPIALLGALAYLTIVVLHLLETRSSFFAENSPLMIFGISLVGVLYSAYLTYLEAAVIHAWCPYCVLSALAITL